MHLALVVVYLAFASANALQACTTSSECACPHFPPGMRGFCTQNACHCHTGSTCTTKADCTSCHAHATVTCEEDAPGVAYCKCNGHEAPPQMQKCTTADTCHDCPLSNLMKLCHNGECQCHFGNECESPKDCYTCHPMARNVTCDSDSNGNHFCHCDGHQAPPKAPACTSTGDCGQCPERNQTVACLSNECHCHRPNECSTETDCKTCPPHTSKVTCDGDGTGDMFCRCDGHPAPQHQMPHGGPGGFGGIGGFGGFDGGNH